MVIENTAVAVRVTGGGNYVTRLAVPEYQRDLQGYFQEILEILEEKRVDNKGVVEGNIFANNIELIG